MASRLILGPAPPIVCLRQQILSRRKQFTYMLKYIKGYESEIGHISGGNRVKSD